MLEKPVVRISWVDDLYSPDLQCRINELLDRDGRLFAIVGHQFTYPGRGKNVVTLTDLMGKEKLVAGPLAARLEKSGPALLDMHLEAAHLYREGLWYGNKPGQVWLVMMHREMVLVLPYSAEERAFFNDLQFSSLAILKRPSSAHEKISLGDRLDRIALQAAGLIDFAWSGGITLHDQDEILPQEMWDLTPSA